MVTVEVVYEIDVDGPNQVRVNTTSRETSSLAETRV